MGTAVTTGTGGPVIRNSWLEDAPEEAREDLRVGLHALLDAVTEADGVPALSEGFVLGIDGTGGRDGHRHLLALAGGQVVGVLAVDASDVADAAATAEIAVHPGFRRRGIAGGLLRDAAAGVDPEAHFSVWAHGDLDAARGLDAGRDDQTVRELLKMSVDCGPDAPDRAALVDGAAAARETVAAAGLEILDYPTACDRFGADLVDTEWLRVNNEAFAWHPEQGGWDLDRLRSARETSWFDPAGVIMLWSTDPVASPQGPQCVGVHWTKRPDGDPHGEVYVVCLADAARGRGLGGPLTLLGIGYLLDGGATAVDLYVEGDNTPAVATYRRLGFEVVHRDVVYRGMV